MYRKNTIKITTLKHNKAYEGETLEVKIQRLVSNKEPLTEGVDLVYTERKEGVQAAYDIRTDRWEVAVEAMDKITQQKYLKREQRQGEMVYDTMTPEQQTEFNTKFPLNKYAKQESKA